jgi:hypothetical protein
LGEQRLVAIGDGLVQLFLFEWLCFQFLARKKKSLKIGRSVFPIVGAFVLAFGISGLFGISRLILSWSFGVFLFLLWLLSFLRQKGKHRIIKARLLFILVFAPLFLVWVRLPHQMHTVELVRLASKLSWQNPMADSHWILDQLRSRQDTLPELEHRMLRAASYNLNDFEMRAEMIGMLQLHHRLSGPVNARRPGCGALSPNYISDSLRRVLCE